MKTNRGRGYFYWCGVLDANIYPKPWLRHCKNLPDWATQAYIAGFYGYGL